MNQDTKKTHWKEMMDYDYIGSYMVQENDLVLTIKQARIEKVESRQSPNGEPKLCIFFNEIKQGMVLNSTNCKIIETLYSPFIEEWGNCKINIYSTPVTAFGKTHDALRIREFVPYKEDQATDALERAKTKSEVLYLIRTCPHITSSNESFLEDARAKYTSLEK